MFKIINKIEKNYDLSLVLMFEGEVKACDCFSAENQNLIKKIAEKKSFKGEASETLTVDVVENGNIVTLTYLGMGKKDKFSCDTFKEVLFGFLSNKKGSILICSDEKELSNSKIIGEIVYNVGYNFDTFKAKKSEEISVELFVEGTIENYSETLTLGEATNITRNLINLPANIINPQTLADEVVKLGKDYGFEVEVLDDNKIQELGMNLLYSVGKASVTKPRVIIMRHLKGNNPNERIGLVGKGLTYDTGGLCIKPPESMFTMKDDMGGAATVIGTMCALAKEKVEKNVIAVIVACENAINGNSYRPGDIIQSMNGKFVEIINTDAEGRLALADGLTYAIRKEKVTELVDIATLTGAICVALGTITTGVFSNCDNKFDILSKNSEMFGEKIWRMPLFDQYKEYLKTPNADLKHTGIRWGGAISAAKFLEEFVEELPWTHIDIAGTAFDSDLKWVKKGASGVMLKSLYGYVKNR